MQSEGIQWYNWIMKDAMTVLQKQHRNGGVNVETTIQVFPFCDGFFVESTTKIKRARDGALCRTDACSWHLDGDHERRAMLAKLEDNGFRVTATMPLLKRAARAVFGWLS